jgi:hypothetical protein
MSDQTIIENMIARLGQSQTERLPVELGAHFVDVDERTAQDLLSFTQALARVVRYYRLENGVSAAVGDWAPFFREDDPSAARLTGLTDGTVAPHLALLGAFLALYEVPREAINRITGRHLDFFYQRVLRFVGRAAVPDRAHVLVELKKGAPPARILPEHRFSAGKDATGAELVYAPTRATVVNAAKVDSLRSVFVDGGGRGTVRFAPIAISSDGLGGELDGEEPKWRAFGHPDLPAAEVGFAVASPVLRLREGRRTIVLFLTVDGLDAAGLTGGAIGGAFQAYLTGEQAWLGPFGLDASVAGDRLRFQLDLPDDQPAVVDCDAAIHGHGYATQAPVLQLLLKADAELGYNDVKNLTLLRAQIVVEAAGVTSLVLESDAGALDPKKAFLPFGPQPIAGARLLVGCAEALSKKLSEVKLTLAWQGAPVSFTSHYNHYGVSGLSDGYFTVSASFRDGGSWQFTRTGVKLFEPRDESGACTLEFMASSPSSSPPAPAGHHVQALQAAGTAWSQAAVLRYVRSNPASGAPMSAAPEPRSGVIVLSLERGFLHATHRQKSVENAVKYGKGAVETLVVLNEPYTPTIQSLSLSYRASSDEVGIASSALSDFSNPDVQFFQVGCFGRMREHGHQRAQFQFVADKRVSLLPAYENEGEFVIGITSVQPGDSMTLLFQVAEGSANPDLAAQDVRWSVLCDNYWRVLTTAEVVHDTTNQLLTSGVITFVIPPEATTINAIMPPGRIWLKAAVARAPDAVCQLVTVAANAVEVELLDTGSSHAHLLAPLPSGKITRLKTPVASVKAVTQPYASFGGRPAETAEAVRTRAAERLRHRNRCLTAWDYERIVLDAFPGVHRAKCIPHARDGAWHAPGHVLVVVVPDLRNKNAIDPLQPKVDANTISRIAVRLRTQAGMQVEVGVKNPRYQKIRLDFSVKFGRGYEFSVYSELLKQEIVRFLSPWAFDATRPVAFGGCIYKSVLLDFVEELAYVDYVTDFKMYSYTGAADRLRDLDRAQAETPDTILVSDSTHSVGEAG